MNNDELTHLEERFLALAKEQEDLKESLNNVRIDLEVVMKEMKMDTFIQDPETYIVYQIVKPTGSFVYYKDIDYVRTKKEGEKAGSLSLKKAEEAGFTVGK